MSTQQAKTSKINFAQFLHQVNVLSASHLNELDVDLKSMQVIEQIKVKGWVEPKRLDELYHTYQGIHFSDMLHMSLNDSCVKRLPSKWVRQYRVVVIGEEFGNLIVGMENPLDQQAIEQLTWHLQQSVMIHLVSKEGINYVIDQYYSHQGVVDHLNDSIRSSTRQYQMTSPPRAHLAQLVDQTDAHQLLTVIIEDAYEKRASDIHIEKDYQQVSIRYRLGHELMPQAHIDPAVADILLRRILVQAEVSAVAYRLPVDASFSLSVLGHQVGFRLSVVYTQSGYSIVIRLLHEIEKDVQLESIVSSHKVLEKLKRYLDNANGMMLLTGPTACGKTTTLYTALNYLNKGHHKIITIEDPVESYIPGLNQVEVNAQLGLDFVDVLRVSLRQNPDVLMLGEIRDEASAAMAVRAAISNQMVMGTVHAKNTVAVIPRLLDFGVDPLLVATGVKLIISTRLVKKNCPHCLEEQKLSADELEMLSLASGLTKAKLSKIPMMKPKGCPVCQSSGVDRMAIFEPLELDSKMIHALSVKDIEQFNVLAHERIKGYTLFDAAFELVKEGTIEVQEALRFHGHKV